jgi:hypothetical protein
LLEPIKAGVKGFSTIFPLAAPKRLDVTAGFGGKRSAGMSFAYEL